LAIAIFSSKIFWKKFDNHEKANADLYSSSLVPWSDPKKNPTDQKPRKLKTTKTPLNAPPNYP